MRECPSGGQQCGNSSKPGVDDFDDPPDGLFGVLAPFDDGRMSGIFKSNCCHPYAWKSEKCAGQEQEVDGT